MKLEVTLESPEGVEPPAFLLVPVPPPNSENRLIGIESNIYGSGVEVQAINSCQKAMAFEVADRRDAKIAYHFRTGDEDLANEFFLPVSSHLNNPSEELKNYVEKITENCCCQQDKLQKLIDITSELFDYDHIDEPFYHGEERMPLITVLTKGNCADIHGFMLSCMYSIGINGNYLSGFYFEEGESTARGFHCWLSSKIEERIQYWDVSQFVMHKVKQVKAGLNPLGGSRIALGVGRGLEFDIGGMPVCLKQFGHPVWIHRDGQVDQKFPIAKLFQNH